MITTLYPNPLLCIPDSFEQRLQNQVRIAYELFQLALIAYAGEKLDVLLLAYFMGWLNIQNQTFFDHYNMLMEFYDLFFILLPTYIGAFLRANMNTMRHARYVFIAADLAYLPITIDYLYSNEITPANIFINSYYLGLQTATYGFSLYEIIQWYIASKNLKEYQHGTRNNRLHFLPTNIKGA